MADEDSVKGWQPLPGKNEEEGIGKAEAMPSVHSADRSSYEEEKKPISSDGEDSRKRLDEVEVSHGDFNAQVCITHNRKIKTTKARPRI